MIFDKGTLTVWGKERKAFGSSVFVFFFPFFLNFFCYSAFFISTLFFFVSKPINSWSKIQKESKSFTKRKKRFIYDRKVFCFIYFIFFFFLFSPPLFSFLALLSSWNKFYFWDCSNSWLVWSFFVFFLNFFFVRHFFARSWKFSRGNFLSVSVNVRFHIDKQKKKKKKHGDFFFPSLPSFPFRSNQFRFESFFSFLLFFIISFISFFFLSPISSSYDFLFIFQQLNKTKKKDNTSLYAIKAILILDSEGKRLFGKYYSPEFTAHKDQQAFEKNIFEKTKRANGYSFFFFFLQNLNFCKSFLLSCIVKIEYWFF